ncbi:MAG: hypothetical protein JXC32_07635, partial [Anaerolineae bacterium]|nr:hypothetical protein [Anaerolineae bacterium]
MRERNRAFVRLGLAVVIMGLLLVGFQLIAGGYQPTAAATLQACVPGPHSGTITGTQHWCLVDSPHRLTGDVIVPAGMTL